ncbi:hypothetical protein FRC08_012487, partial [Ceratobasidium sp. 394]
MNRLKRHFLHPSRSVTPEPQPGPSKYPKLTSDSTPGSTRPPSRSSNEATNHASFLRLSLSSPHPTTGVTAPPLGEIPQNPVPQIHISAPPSPSTTSRAQFPETGCSTPHSKWTGLERFAKLLRPSTKAFEFGPLKSAIDAIAETITIYEAASEANEEYKALRNELDWLFHDLAGRFGEPIPPGMRPAIINLARSIEQEISLLREKGLRKTLNRCIEARQDADQVLKCYRRVQALLERLALNANVNIWMLVEEQATLQRLDRLSPSHGAWYSSAESEAIYRDECTPDTRLEVLERFRIWQDDSEGPKIYWLNGMAGTGKTTLAYTLCKHLEGDNRLAANFFCSRQLPSCKDATRILPTIAYQLANFSYPFRYSLSQVLAQNPDIHTRRISEQFEKLLYNPLYGVQRSLPFSIIVVIDGLDECDNDHGVGEFLDVLFNRVSDMPIKFFLTSRPEPAIRSRMLRRKGDRDRFELHLHELDKGVVGEDIKKYLQAGLTHPDLTLTDEHLEILTERSGVLFIYAATVVRYISADDFLRSEGRLQDVLEATTGSNHSEQDISSLYNLILGRAFRRLNPREQDEMQLTLGAVICAQEPLTIRFLAGLSGLKGERSVHAILGLLRSVLNVQQDETVTTLHKSFPDHMLDPARSLHFCCDPKKHNRWLAQRCFDLIGTSSPLFNICRLDSSYVLDKDVTDLGQRVKRYIPEELLYACRYWGAHIQLAAQSKDLLNGLYHFLSVGLLLWMEVMNLTKFMQPGIEMLRQVDLREWDK